ncbi:MAG: hypothetical protein AB9834_13620 [Lentimicrobium sp.]
MNSGNKSEIQLSEQFWSWFKENNNKYLFLNQIDPIEIKEKLVDEFAEQLHRFCDELFFEIGGHPNDQKVELIITAEGVFKNFEKVELLVNSAPQMEDWKIIAFKPPMGKGFKTAIDGKEFDPSKIIFIPLNNEEDPKGVGIHVCYPDYTKEERPTFVNGTYIALDCLIGEKSTTLDIDYLDVIRTPDNISEYDIRHLEDIQEYIDEKKNG